MNENHTPTPVTATTSEDWPPYPEYGSQEDVHARMMLLKWIWEQLATGAVKVEPGDHVLATDGRILGVDRDGDELLRRLLEAEPALRKARIVGYTVTPYEY